MDMKSYQAGREDQLIADYEKVMNDGITALGDEIRFRKITGLHMSTQEMDLFFTKHYDGIQQALVDSILVVMIAVLHDEFHFGTIRIKRAMQGYDKATQYINNGWIKWFDFVAGIKEQIGEDLFNATSKNLLFTRYAHPDLDDVYADDTAPPLVMQDAWEKLLKSLEFGEQQNKDDKTIMEIFDQNKKTQFRYMDIWEKVGMYDFLEGVRWGKLHDWSREAVKNEPPKEEKQRQSTPRKKKRKHR